MNYESLVIDCTKVFQGITKSYNMVKVRFDRRNEEDLAILQAIETEAKKLAPSVNKQAASETEKTRDTETLYANALAGMLSEHAWKHYLNSGVLQNGVTVSSTESKTSINQIDLLSSNGKTIEVRSSGVKNGIKFALCNSEHMFDILGPYTNGVKPTAIYKDIYLRTLFNYDLSKLVTIFKENIIIVYLLGGATKSMMQDPTVYEIKSMKKDDPNGPEGSEYYSIKYSKALDTIQITQTI
ncbi:MAG: hypothetical protein JEZ05_00330 [Tenericutes bacterium]|nr:hypothetical protein [Mycoplasmatota bacterium]